MTTNAPEQHVIEAQKLTADALVDLYEVTLTDGVTYVRFRDGPQVTWQGKTYESMGARISGIQQSTDGAKMRPTLTVVNPAGIWNAFAHQGLIDGARVTRRQVLRQYLEEDIGLADSAFWYVSRIREIIKNQGATFELRALTDGPDLKIPARVYIPPEFPFVTI